MSNYFHVFVFNSYTQPLTSIINNSYSKTLSYLSFSLEEKSLMSLSIWYCCMFCDIYPLYTYIQINMNYMSFCRKFTFYGWIVCAVTISGCAIHFKFETTRRTIFIQFSRFLQKDSIFFFLEDDHVPHTTFSNGEMMFSFFHSFYFHTYVLHIMLKCLHIDNTIS